MDLINKGVAEGNFDMVEKKERVVYQKIETLPDFACITINQEDHTLGNIVRQSLLRDRRTRFAGYRKPHPLYDLVELKVQSNGEVRPFELVTECCKELVQHVDKIDNAFETALQNFDGGFNPNMMPAQSMQMHGVPPSAIGLSGAMRPGAGGMGAYGDPGMTSGYQQ